MVTVIPVVIRALRTIPKGFVKGLGRLGNKRTSGDHLDYGIIKIGQNTGKNPRDFLSLKLLWKIISLHRCEKRKER